MSGSHQGPQPERLHLEAGYMAAPVSFRERSDSFPLHRGRRPYMAHMDQNENPSLPGLCQLPPAADIPAHDLRCGKCPFIPLIWLHRGMSRISNLGGGLTLSQVARIEACAKRKRKSGALSPDFAAVANAPARSIRATIRSMRHAGGSGCVRCTAFARAKLLCLLRRQKPARTEREQVPGDAHALCGKDGMGLLGWAV